MVGSWKELLPRISISNLRRKLFFFPFVFCHDSLNIGWNVGEEEGPPNNEQANLGVEARGSLIIERRGNVF